MQILTLLALLFTVGVHATEDFSPALRGLQEPTDPPARNYLCELFEARFGGRIECDCARANRNFDYDCGYVTEICGFETDRGQYCAKPALVGNIFRVVLQATVVTTQFCLQEGKIIDTAIGDIPVEDICVGFQVFGGLAGFGLFGLSGSYGDEACAVALCEGGLGIELNCASFPAPICVRVPFIGGIRGRKVDVEVPDASVLAP